MLFGPAKSGTTTKRYGKNRALDSVQQYSGFFVDDINAINDRENITPALSVSDDCLSNSNHSLNSTGNANSKKRNQPNEDDSKNSRARHTGMNQGRSKGGNGNPQGKQLRTLIEDGHKDDVEHLCKQVNHFCSIIGVIELCVVASSSWDSRSVTRFEDWIQKLGFHRKEGSNSKNTFVYDEEV
jgi:hypothetical protein